MSHVSIERRAHRLPAAGRLAAWLERAWRAWRNRMAARQLQALDDRILADIGLRRTDVDRALSLPLWQDPTLELHKLVMERRRARRP